MARRIRALRNAAVLCGLVTAPASALTITIDYSQDTSGFFTSNPAAKVSLEAAAARIGAMLTTPLAATTDTSSATVGDANATFNFNFSYSNPSTGSTTNFDPAVVPAGTVIIFAGARALSGNTIGFGGPGGLGFMGSGGYVQGNSTSFANFQAAVMQAAANGSVNLKRGGGPIVNTVTGSFGTPDGNAPFSVSYGIDIGSITFDNDTDNNGIPDSAATLNSFWNFDYTQPTGGKNDFYSVALHELTHAMGFSSTQSFTSFVSASDSRDWTGANLINVLGTGDNVLAPDSKHFADGLMATRTTDNVTAETLMDPILTQGDRKDETFAELAALRDIGWQTVPLAATLQHWLPAGSGSWDTAGNWTGAARPSPVSQVIIDPASGLTVTGSATSAFAQSLVVGDGAHAVVLQLGAGPLTVTNGLQIKQGSSITAGAASQLIVLGGTFSLTNSSAYSNAGSLVANTVSVGGGTFTQTGPMSIVSSFTVTAGTVALGGAESWTSGSTLTTMGGSVTLAADPGASGVYPMVLSVTPATGTATFHFASHAGDQAHLSDLHMNAPGAGGSGLVVVDAAADGSQPNPRTGFGGTGGSVAVYIGNGAGGVGLAPRITVENLWRSAALEGYWALQNHLVTSVTRGLTLANGVVSNTSRNGLAVLSSVDNGNNPATYVGEDITGDTNGDGKVDINDLGVVLQHLNTTPGSQAGESAFTIYTPGEGDVNGDLVVNINDLGAVLGNLNLVYAPSSGGGASDVPEPASSMLLAIGAAAMLVRRRRVAN